MARSTTPSPDAATAVRAPRVAAPFPYDQLLAFLGGDLTDAEAAQKVGRKLETDPRWRLHAESLRSLDLERAVAKQDRKGLVAYLAALEGTKPSAACVEVARTGGNALVASVRGDGEPPGGEAHVRTCVYCTRMRRLVQSRVLAEAHGLQPGEMLLRDYVLGRYYRDALDAVTRRLAPPDDDATLLGNAAPAPRAADEGGETLYDRP